MITPVSYNFNQYKNPPNRVAIRETEKVSERVSIDFDRYNACRFSLNKMNISFGQYHGDLNPAQRLFYLVTGGRNAVYEDDWTKRHLTHHVGIKKWVDDSPAFMLKRTPEEAIQSICTIIKPGLGFPEIPSNIKTPDFGDKWGRHANYVEINPRIIATFKKENPFDCNSEMLMTEGLFGAMKLLPLLPPSTDKFANCLILSELYTPHSNSGTMNETSLYGINFKNGISKTLLSTELEGKMTQEEQLKAYNDLAHVMGFKTGFRMLLAEGQMWVKGEPFNWNNPYHEKVFIEECVNAIDMGFDAIYFDSAKHIIQNEGGFHRGNLPNKNQMAYITKSIRDSSNRNDLSFIGEKCVDNYEYESMGLTAGTGFGSANSKGNVMEHAKRQAWNSNYAAGFEVTNDNYGRRNGNGDLDEPLLSSNEKLYRINACLSGYERTEDKIPSFMQLDDLYPLSPFTNTHELMEKVKKMNGDGWTDCEKHWDGIFSNSQEAINHRDTVNMFFKRYMYN